MRYVDVTFFVLIIKSILVAAFVIFLPLLLIEFLTGRILSFTSLEFILFIVFSLTFLISSRIIAVNFFKRRNHDRRVVIYGAGSAGIQLANALKVSSEMKPIAFVDENKTLHGSYMSGLKIIDPKKLKELLNKRKIDEVLIAIPSAAKKTLSKLLKDIEKHSVKVRILPGLAELAQGKISVSELKEVEITDLLGRYEVEANLELLNRNINSKVVLITGAGGSIGSEITRQVVNHSPKKIIILDSNEYALYQIRNEIESNAPEIDLNSIICNVTSKNRIKTLCETFQVDTIYHTAAYKHVLLVEENPFEGVINNIFGTKSCLEAAIETEVETFVLISTDKAVRPTNFMGASKRFAELILQAYSAHNLLSKKTRMTMVRFGNVLGSSGSAIPLFQQQIREGGPVTVTHPEVIRYFMSIPEAAELVIQAGAMGEGGDVFVLDMGEPVKIYDLAKRLINLSGMELQDVDNPEGDIEIIFTGLRPGEKLYEELLIGDNVSTTEHKQILRAEEDFLEVSDLAVYLESLKEAEKNGDVISLRNILSQVISGFIPAEEIVDVVYKQRNNL
jgi:FlaA1/EpsC-like NDP-sugar epimerase